MRNVNVNVLSAGDSVNTNGSTVDASQLVSASFQCVFGDTNAAGTFKLQASNDVFPQGYQASLNPFVVTNWTDVPNETATITSGASAILIVAQNAYRWLRAVYTSTATGAQTVVPIADTGAKQVQTVTAIGDTAGSLNSKYFLASSVNLTSKAQKNFYVWFDDGAGVDPAIAGRTGVHVTYTDGDSANTIATAVRAAMAALTDDWTITGSNAAIIITNKAFGSVPAAADSTAATGFTFPAPSTPGVASNLNNKYFYLDSANAGVKYVVWMNVDSIGTAPVIAGRTATEVDFASHATAATIGTALASAVDALTEFAATGTTTVTITNSASGPFVPIVDAGATGFTFAITAGGTTTINVTMNALSI